MAEKAIGWVSEIHKQGSLTRQVSHRTRKDAVGFVQREVARLEEDGWVRGKSVAGRVGKVVRSPYGQRIVWSSVRGVPERHAIDRAL